MGIQERMIFAVGRDIEPASRHGATANYTIRNCLDFAKKTIPDFMDLIRGRSVLDYGCGPGWQAVAMALNGAKTVCAVDIRDDLLLQGATLAQAHGVSDRITFTKVPSGVFDIAFSLGSFEHFAEPEEDLARMASLVRSGGLVIISFAEPWYSHSGSHMNDFIRLPWLNLLFSEKAILNARRRYRNDGARRWQDVVGGLNRMTITRFERIIRKSGLEVLSVHLYATLGIPFVTRLPVLRELLTSACCAVLRKP